MNKFLMVVLGCCVWAGSVAAPLGDGAEVPTFDLGNPAYLRPQSTKQRVVFGARPQFVRNLGSDGDLARDVASIQPEKPYKPLRLNVPPHGTVSLDDFKRARRDFAAAVSRNTQAGLKSDYALKSPLFHGYPRLDKASKKALYLDAMRFANHGKTEVKEPSLEQQKAALTYRGHLLDYAYSRQTARAQSKKLSSKKK